MRKIKMNSSSGSSIMSAPAPAAKKTVAKVAKKEEVVAVAAPVAVAPPAAPVAAVEKKATKAKAVKAEVAAAAPVAATPAVVAASAVASAAEPVAEVPVQTVGEEIKLMVTGVTTMRETLGGLLTQLKKLEKRVGREIKDARKRKRRVRVDGRALR